MESISRSPGRDLISRPNECQARVLPLCHKAACVRLADPGKWPVPAKRAGLMYKRTNMSCVNYRQLFGQKEGVKKERWRKNKFSEAQKLWYGQWLESQKSIVTRMPFSQRPTVCLFEKLYGKCAPDFTHPAKSWCVGVVDMHYFDLDLGTQSRPRYGSDLLAC